MSTEQKDLESNALAARLGRGWEKFKQGKLISYPMMAVLLLVVTGLGLWWWIARERVKEASKTWVELEGANTVSALEEYAKSHPNSKAGRVARLDEARYRLGPEGIDLLASRDPRTHDSAVENIERARAMFEDLAGELKDDPVLRAECYLGCAKAEEALIGISRKDNPLEFRGSPDRLVEWLNKLAEAAPDTPWAEDARKLAAAVKDNTNNTRNELINVQSGLAKLPASPTLGPLPPLGPGGTLPGAPGIPSLPGFTPAAPGGPAPGTTTPGTPGTTPPNPTPPAGAPPMVPPSTPPGTTQPMPPAGLPPGAGVVPFGGAPPNPTPPKEPTPTPPVPPKK